MTDTEKKSKVKDTVKRLVPCWIISFVSCYMLFIYEPLVMYCTNKDDFWFDFGIMIGPVMCVFLIFFLSMAVVLTAVSVLSEKISEVVLMIVFSVFIMLYIQGNFFTNNLPALDGSEVDWGLYTAENVKTLIVCLAVTAVLIFTLIKSDHRKLMVYASGVSLAVFVMLTVSLVTTSVQNDLFKSQSNFIGTANYLNGASSDKNFFIFMVDSQSATEFTQVISEREELQHAFDDFTYYPDTLSAYAYTRDSIPFVLSGQLNKNEEDFGDYSRNALNGSPFFKELDSRGYDFYLYDHLVWQGEKSYNIQNSPNIKDPNINFRIFFDQEMRYVWFKYLPYIFKGAVGIENLDFGRSLGDVFNWRNDVLYKELKNAPISKTSGAQFRFIHAEGAHVPLDMDESMERIEHGTYLQKTAATATLISAFIERLKEYGVYDNSVIIIMADHGYQPATGKPDNYILSRFNPILLIKGFDEKHELVYSDKPVSYLDLPQAYTDLLDGKQSSELFSDAAYPRTRTVIWYEIYSEEHMVEYQTDGKATEWDKFKETGEVFDLS